MQRPFWKRLGLVTAVTLAGLSAAACSDQALEPATDAAPGATPAFAKAPNLGGCDSLAAPAGHRLAVTVFARGVQIYRWTGSAWGLVAPSADLFPNEAASGRIGTHFAGPTWQSVSGGKVVGSVLKRCTADPAAVQWLLLAVTADDGPGLFHGATYIQRINTAGGVAPTTPGGYVGDEARIPYTTQYLFYRGE